MPFHQASPAEPLSSGRSQRGSEAACHGIGGELRVRAVDGGGAGLANVPPSSRQIAPARRVPMHCGAYLERARRVRNTHKRRYAWVLGGQAILTVSDPNGTQDWTPGWRP